MNCKVCSEIQLLLCCLSSVLDLYLCQLTVGGCNVDFMIAVSAVVCMVMALSVSPLTDIFAAGGAADC